MADKNTLPDSVKTYINNNKITKAYVLGDTDIISDKVANKLPNITRITGNNEYERNINIIKNFQNDIDFSNICIASGKDFPDSLSGSALAAMNSSAIVLVDDKNSQGVTTEFIKGKLSKVSNVYIFGLQGAVNDSVIQSLFNK
ncbi:cell wall-binding repeat-containing protein [Clostridium sp. OS1-26]|uniref:cell wall-binding repeat-containing protein n=1 Tax=Clostridium sp. OS1-26 TaxID=3070681 RepID=UPI0027DF30B5|nr:cell wall-binding repeat-containing protein [Clostridium sp. OS1-26]WML36733.1 cell wall-binding repeat-containing protein [Clostridium sp. OS1-26]